MPGREGNDILSLVPDTAEPAGSDVGDGDAYEGYDVVQADPGESAVPVRHDVADTTATAEPLYPGAQVDKYELIRELGRGGMGTVFLARDTKLGRRVAIKFLHSDQSEITARFLVEARATAQCHHENIVVIHDVGEHGLHPYMVLEYINGVPLSMQLQEGRTLTPSRAVEIMVPVVRALACAHKRRIVHRDLKPDNIVVTESGTVKVLDFGVAKLVQRRTDAWVESNARNLVQEGSIPPGSIPPGLLPPGGSLAPGSLPPGSLPPGSLPPGLLRPGGSLAPGSLVSALYSAGVGAGHSMLPGASPALTQRGALVGTLPYMSPEQWGADTVDHRTDIWAVGIILFEMLAGAHPLAPRQGRELIVTGLLDEPMPGIRSVCPTLPDALAHVIDRCLIKPRNERIGSAEELLDALEPLLHNRSTRKLHIGQSPYAGLSAFQESDTHRFFGRAKEIAAAVTRLGDRPLLGVVGPSGVGKSSFIRAGVVPALKQSGDAWTTQVIRPGRHPLAALAHLILSMADQSTANSAVGDLDEHEGVIERLRAQPGYLGTALRRQARKRNHHILLFVDQFEELYTLGADERERSLFTACLAAVADDATTPLRVVLSIRSDFLDRVPEDEHFMAELSRGLFFLTPPRRDGLRDALIQPAELAGYQFESRTTVEHMLDHLEHIPGALPLLQFAATKLWEGRDTERRLLTDASYQHLGGIAGALASHADAVLNEFPTQDRALVRALLLRLVTPERTRAVVEIQELHELTHDPHDVQRLVDHLVRARLLVIQTGDGGGGILDVSPGNVNQGDADASGHPVAGGHSAAVEIVHESLIHSWPTLRRWLDETQDDAAFLDQLRTAARQWQARGYPAGLLWSGEAAREARRWHQRYAGQLPEHQRAYLDAVFRFATRAERRRRRILAAVISLLSCIAVVAVVAALWILDAERESAQQAARARQAEVRTRAQLEETEAARQALELARSQITAERDRAEQANEKLASANDALQARTAELQAAVKRAKRARRRARKQRDRAREMAERARAMTEVALEGQARLRDAKEELERTLDKVWKKLNIRRGGGKKELIKDVKTGR